MSSAGPAPRGTGRGPARRHAFSCQHGERPAPNIRARTLPAPPPSPPGARHASRPRRRRHPHRDRPHLRHRRGRPRRHRHPGHDLRVSQAEPGVLTLSTSSVKPGQTITFSGTFAEPAASTATGADHRHLPGLLGRGDDEQDQPRGVLRVGDDRVGRQGRHLHRHRVVLGGHRQRPAHRRRRGPRPDPRPPRHHRRHHRHRHAPRDRHRGVVGNGDQRIEPRRSRRPPAPTPCPGSSAAPA